MFTEWRDQIGVNNNLACVAKLAVEPPLQDEFDLIFNGRRLIWDDTKSTVSTTHKRTCLVLGV